MSIQYTELLGSRQVTRNAAVYTASRTFLVYDDTASFLSLEDAVNYEFGVQFSDVHPDISGIYANAFTITASRERKDTWELSWQYGEPTSSTDAGGDEDPYDDDSDNTDNGSEDDDIFDPPSGGGGGGGGGGGSGGGDAEEGDDGVEEDEPPEDDTGGTAERTFTGVSINASVVLVDGYVGSPTIPALGSQGGDDGYEIPAGDGTIVHVGGEPVTVPIPITTIAISASQGGEYYSLNNTNLKAGKRNSSPFYGFDAGSVLFTGMSVQRQDIDSWDITYNFAWDEWSHMRQVPNRDSDGELAPEPDGTLKIFLKQPFPNRTSFEFAP